MFKERAPRGGKSPADSTTDHLNHFLDMAKKITLKAAPRLRSGSGKLKQMRREGWLPSVVYGRGVENANLKVDAKTFAELLAHSSSDSILINLDVEGEGVRSVFLKTIQHDALTGKALHVDFLAVDDKTEITANIPVHLNGEAIGVKGGGILEQYAHTLEITCLPDALPDTIEVDITALELGESLHIGDLNLPKGVKATHAAEVVVAHIGKPAALVAEEAAVVAPAPAAKAAPAAK